MEAPSYSQIVTVANRQGLHLRPADLFVKLAKQFEADVQVVKDSLRVDGKSILDITTLGAAKDTQLAIITTGKDAREALDALADLIERRLAEEDTEEPVPEERAPG